MTKNTKTSKQKTTILTIEDRGEVSKVLDQCLDDLSDSSNSIEVKKYFAEDFNSAIYKLLMRRFNIISADLMLEISEKNPSEINIQNEFGLKVLNSGKRSSLTKTIIYSGSDTNDTKFKAMSYAGEKGVIYLNKGALQRPEKYPPRCNPWGWADCIAHLAEAEFSRGDNFAAEVIRHHPDLAPRLLPYFPSYWRDAPEHLPTPLAREADTIHQALDDAAQRGSAKIDSTAVLAAQRFRQWCLVFARAQTAILARHRQQTWPPLSLLRPTNANPDAHLLEIENSFQQLDKLPPVIADHWPRWLNHLRDGDTPDANTLGLAAQAVRLLRNKTAHTLSAQHRVDRATLRQALWGLMDTAAYWSDTPWFTHLRWQDGRWRGDPAVGLQPSRQSPIDLPAIKQPPSTLQRDKYGQDTCVYQVQWQHLEPFSRRSPSDETGDPSDFECQVVNAWPWLRYDRTDDRSDRQIIALWSPKNRGPDGTEWLAYGFDGTPTRVTVADSDFNRTG